MMMMMISHLNYSEEKKKQQPTLLCRGIGDRGMNKNILKREYEKSKGRLGA